MGSKNEVHFPWFKAYVTICQLVIVVYLVRSTRYFASPLGLWMCFCGLSVLFPVWWVPYNGKVRWILVGAGTSLLLTGLILFTHCCPVNR